MSEIRKTFMLYCPLEKNGKFYGKCYSPMIMIFLNTFNGVKEKAQIKISVQFGQLKISV